MKTVLETYANGNGRVKRRVPKVRVGDKMTTMIVPSKNGRCVSPNRIFCPVDQDLKRNKDNDTIFKY